MFVEGEFDAGFLGRLFQLNERQRIQVIPLGGKDNIRQRREKFNALFASIEAWSLAPGADSVRWLGIALDADDDPAAAFDRGRTAVERHWQTSFTPPQSAWLPERAAATGCLALVVVFPKPHDQGDIERFIWERALESTPIGQCAESYAHCLSDAGHDDERRWKFRVNNFVHVVSTAGQPRTTRQRGEYLAELIDHRHVNDLIALTPADFDQI